MCALFMLSLLGYRPTPAGNVLATTLLQTVFVGTTELSVTSRKLTATSVCVFALPLTLAPSLQTSQTASDAVEI